MSIDIGEVIGSYTILEKIGQGGMGEVFKVTDGEKNLAIKFCTDGNSIRRFKREVRIQERLTHKNIVPIIDKNLDIETPYFIMPLAKGSIDTISSLLKNDLEKCYNIFKDICDGLSSIHLSKNFHRDIKPSNVLIFEDESIKISDFGLAKMELTDSSSHSSSNRFIGTVGYHAPEQLQGKDSDNRTDIFQLGKTFYQMYTSHLPHLIDKSLLPSALFYILDKATKANPKDRYQTVSEFKQAIHTFVQAQNPEINPHQAIENNLSKIKIMAENGIYDSETYNVFFNLISNFDNEPGNFISYFDRLPDQTLKIFASNFSDKFENLMGKYTQNLESYFSSSKYLNFQYAEIIANNMLLIFNNTLIPKIKALAIINTLRSSHWLNRFYAMDIFDKMIMNLIDESVATLVAQMLNDNIDIYKVHADRISDEYLHPSIKIIKHLALKDNN